MLAEDDVASFYFYVLFQLFVLVDLLRLERQSMLLYDALVSFQRDINDVVVLVFVLAF